MNFAALRAAVLERTGLTANDPLAADGTLKNLVNYGLHHFEMAAPKGWDWLRVTGTFNTVNGTDAYTFASIVTGLAKVISLRVNVGGTYSDPLPIISKAELYGFYSANATALPECAAAEDQTVYLRPIPDGVYIVGFDGVRSEPDLSADADLPITPAIYHQAIVEKAAELCFRRTQNRQAATVCAQAFAELVGRARGYSNPQVGPGRVRDTNASYRGNF